MIQQDGKGDSDSDLDWFVMQERDVAARIDAPQVLGSPAIARSTGCCRFDHLSLDLPLELFLLIRYSSVVRLMFEFERWQLAAVHSSREGGAEALTPHVLISCESCRIAITSMMCGCISESAHDTWGLVLKWSIPRKESTGGSEGASEIDLGQQAHNMSPDLGRQHLKINLIVAHLTTTCDMRFGGNVSVCFRVCCVIDAID